MPYSLAEQYAGVVGRQRATMTLQDQVAQLYLEGRDDVYRYLLSLGLYPPQAQEGAQEVFLRL
jgi:DNA-directed RNA polymerase specialized sigma24 family protein